LNIPEGLKADYVKALEAQKRIKREKSNSLKGMPAIQKGEIKVESGKSTLTFQNPEFQHENFKRT